MQVWNLSSNLQGPQKIWGQERLQSQCCYGEMGVRRRTILRRPRASLKTTCLKQEGCPWTCTQVLWHVWCHSHTVMHMYTSHTHASLSPSPRVHMYTHHLYTCPHIHTMYTHTQILEKLRQDDHHKFEARLGYVVSVRPAWTTV